jgi:hypothetical protein
MQHEKSEDSVVGELEDPALETVPEPESEPELATGAPDRKHGASTLSKVVGTAAVLALVLSVLFGVLWGISSTELRDSQSSLADQTARLAAAQAKLTDAKGELADANGEIADVTEDLVDSKLANFILQRGAEYTACLSYYGGFYSGAGIPTNSSVTLAKGSCASESAWNIDIQPAP